MWTLLPVFCVRAAALYWQLSLRGSLLHFIDGGLLLICMLEGESVLDGAAWLMRAYAF